MSTPERAAPLASDQVGAAPSVASVHNCPSCKCERTTLDDFRTTERAEARRTESTEERRARSTGDLRPYIARMNADIRAQSKTSEGGRDERA